MSETLIIALAQLNPKVGSLRYNADKAIDAIKDVTSGEKKADLIVFPECYLSGYPVEDLIYKDAFLEAVDKEVAYICEHTKDLDIGIMLPHPSLRQGYRYNGLSFIYKGEIIHEYYKNQLPNYGVFDERRIFQAGQYGEPIEFKGLKIAPQICFDIWFEDGAIHYADKGADIIISPNASPFETLKFGRRGDVVADRINDTGLPLIYLNLIGGQDDLVFDGASFIMNGDGLIPVLMDFGKEQILLTEWKKQDDKWACITRTTKEPDDYISQLYQILVLGLKDYANKNGFKDVILGMSGGIDSAFCAALAVDAFGPDHVKTYMMPSPFTSKESFEDAKACAEALGAHYEELSIEPIMHAYSSVIGHHLKNDTSGLGHENMQSRARGLMLMTLSNIYGGMVLATGNKSEYAVGYATLYGDMCGGYAPIKDVYKTTVFKLAQWRNENSFEGALGPRGEVIPQRIITKAPTAELRADQKDEDSLPIYPILDGILRGLIEFEKSVDELVAQGYERHVVLDVWKLLDRAEYKRRQAPPGTKFTDKAFGKERRYPITNGFIHELQRAAKDT